MRDFKVRAGRGSDHMTGRICETPGCMGDLKDTGINFGEQLIPRILNKGFDECGKSDLELCMGSSMRVTPACDMPFEAKKKGGKVVIVNL